MLFQPRQGPLLLFYKVGPSPSRWWGMLITSDDGGRNWSEPRRLPSNILGPIKNKPIQLADGRLLCPSSDEQGRWRIHLEWTDETAMRWRRGPPLNDGRSFAAIQPCLLAHAGGRLQILPDAARSGRQCWSEDGGESWTPLAATELPNPDSGIDAATLASGQALLVYNHSHSARTPLNMAISDDGRHWSALACWRMSRANSPTPPSSRDVTAGCT